MTSRWNYYARALLALSLLAGLLTGLAGASLIPARAAPGNKPLASCATTTIAYWTFVNNSVAPESGAGTLQYGTGNSQPTFLTSQTSAENPAISFTNWKTPTKDTTAYLDFAVDTTGRDSIGVSFKSRVTSTGPQNLEIDYSIDDGATYNPVTTSTLTTDSSWHLLTFDLSPVSAINNTSQVNIRLYAYGASGTSGAWRLDNINITGNCLAGTDTPIPPSPIVQPKIIISQFRTRGPAGASDEFVELYNADSTAVDISNWALRASSSDGTPSDRAVIPSGVSLQPGQHYLIANTSYVGSVTPDLQYGTSIADDGGLAIFSSANLNIPVDKVGMSDGSAYYEGTPLAPLSGNSDQSYERNSSTPPCAYTDSDNNAADFILRIPSDPHNSSSPLNVCGDPTSTPTLTPSPTATATFTPTRTPTITGTLPSPTATATPTMRILINEVAWAGTIASPSDEWIELYNPGSATISLENWILKASDNSVYIPLHGSIAGGGYFLLAHDGTFKDETIDETFTDSISNSGLFLQLIDPTGIVTDTANSDGGAWPAGYGYPYYDSMERHSTDLDSPTAWYTFKGTPYAHDRYNNLVYGTPKQANWATSVTATPSPKATATKTKVPTRIPTRIPTPIPIVVINEFLPRAGFDWNQDGQINTFDEFIEIANLGPGKMTLNGWKLDVSSGDSSPYTIPLTVLAEGQHVVFYGSQTNIVLHDSGDTVRLLNASNAVMDAKTYTVVKKADQSWCRLPDIRGSWYSDCSPTPNFPNRRTGPIPVPVPGTGLEEPFCPLADTVPEDFRLAECNDYGADMWQSGYWDKSSGQGDQVVPQDSSKWETFIE